MPSPTHDTAEHTLEQLRAGRSWKAAFQSARAAEDGERPAGWDDASLIEIYRECLVRGLTFQADPDTFLEACKRLSRLLFRYGRSREANNYLLQLRDLSPDPSSVPAWAWAYSAKLAYQEDIDYCIRKPREVIGYLENALSANASDSQASAVLADFINTSTRHLSEHPDRHLAEGLSTEIRNFFEDRSLQDSVRIVDALDRLDHLTDDVTPTRSTPDVATEETTSGALSWRKKAEQLGTRLDRATEEVADLTKRNSELEQESQELRLELHMLREQVEQRSTSLDRLTGLILRLENWVQSIEVDWKAIQETTPPAPEEEPSSPPKESGELLPARSRIVVVGESRVAEAQLAGICKSLGIEKDRIDFRLSYKAFDSLDINTLQYNDSVAGILIGPVPHKVPGQDDPAQALLTKEGFPPTVKVENNSGVLKITKSSFREALQNLLTLIASVEPTAE